VVGGGFFCYPAMADDPWLHSLRKKTAFTRLLRQAELQHRRSREAFASHGGDRVLGLVTGAHASISHGHVVRV
jgi:hypothetical protein